MFHYLLLMLAAMFWIFRIVVAVTFNMGIEFGIEPLNFTAEIVLLFVTLFCFILIVKRNLFGALLYLISSLTSVFYLIITLELSHTYSSM